MLGAETKQLMLNVPSAPELVTFVVAGQMSDRGIWGAVGWLSG